MWQELHKRCEHAEAPYEGYKFVPKPTAALLDRFEKSRGLVLPISYREFVSQFGAGELAGFYRVAAPLPYPGDYDLATFSHQLHGEPDERLLEMYGPPDVTVRFLFFAADGGGDFFGWKTDETTDQAGHEYAVYRFAFGPCERIASSFASWVRGYVLTADPTRGWTPELTFRRFQVEA